jgi:hypothetical protein
MNRREAFDWIEKNVAPSSCPLLAELEENSGAYASDSYPELLAEVRRINARLRNALVNALKYVADDRPAGYLDTAVQIEDINRETEDHVWLSDGGF